MIFFIFIFALILRFLYFPSNIYFGYDQARDAFAAHEILNGHLKLIGPPTTFEGLRHGVLYYYIYAPFYWLAQGDPAMVAALLRVVNALGVFLIFAIGYVLFNISVGLIVAWLYAISFEQTQFAMYFNHPSLAVISILVMYFGLSLLIFKRRDFGLIIAFLGLGLSIQFEFILTYLIVPFIVILFVFRKSIPNISFKIFSLGFISFLITVLTFLIAEIKFSFRSSNLLPQLLFGNANKSLYRIISTYLFEMAQVVKFNLVGIEQLRFITGLAFFFSFLSFLFSKVKKQMIFLGIWFFSTITVYFITGGSELNVDVIQYHPNVGASLSLGLFSSYLLYVIGKRTSYLFAIAIIILITSLNISLIQKINPSGSMPEINAQSFMLLSDEKKVLDFIYTDAEGNPFAIKAVTLPFYINSTWSYLFEWYGKQRYGYLPIWGGKNAIGYPGNLPVEEAQDKLPDKRYLIIEPIRGIPTHLINAYLEEESYFTNLQEERKIGSFIVQTRRVKKVDAVGQ